MCSHIFPFFIDLLSLVRIGTRKETTFDKKRMNCLFNENDSYGVNLKNRKKSYGFKSMEMATIHLSRTSIYNRTHKIYYCVNYRSIYAIHALMQSIHWLLRYVFLSGFIV